MKKWAEIEDGVVRALHDAPDNLVLEIASPYKIVEVTNTNPRPKQGWYYKDGVFSQVGTPTRKPVQIRALWERFTDNEQETLVSHAHPKVKRFIMEMQMNANSIVNLVENPFVARAINAMEAAGILDAGRAAEILQA